MREIKHWQNTQNTENKLMVIEHDRNIKIYFKDIAVSGTNDFTRHTIIFIIFSTF